MATTDELMAALERAPAIVIPLVRQANPEILKRRPAAGELSLLPYASGAIGRNGRPPRAGLLEEVERSKGGESLRTPRTVCQGAGQSLRRRSSSIR